MQDRRRQRDRALRARRIRGLGNKPADRADGTGFARQADLRRGSPGLDEHHEISARPRTSMTWITHFHHVDHAVVVSLDTALL